MSRKLDESEVRQRLAERPEWRLEGGEMRRELTFADFSQAWGFMNRVALIAEKLDHHPAWSNVYNRVTIGLSTHDVGGISEKDFEFAARVDRLLA